MTKDEYDEGLEDALSFSLERNPFGIACADALALAAELEEHNEDVGIALRRVVDSVEAFIVIVRAAAEARKAELAEASNN